MSDLPMAAFASCSRAEVTNFSRASAIIGDAVHPTQLALEFCVRYRVHRRRKHRNLAAMKPRLWGVACWMGSRPTWCAFRL